MGAGLAAAAMLAGLIPATTQGPALCPPPRLEPITGESLADYWVAQPTRDEMISAFPKQAIAERVSGRVGLLCAVGGGGALVECQVQTEEPGGYGFAQAAIRLSGRFRLLETVDGCPTRGGRVGFPINFRVR